MLTPIRTETAQNIALNMFVLLSTGYTPGSGPTGELGATTGGGTFTATPEFRVPGPKRIKKEHKRVHGYRRVGSQFEMLSRRIDRRPGYCLPPDMGQQQRTQT